MRRLSRRHLLSTLALPLAARAQTAAPRRPQILLISGWNTKNIGDVAHTPGFLRLVERHWPEAQVTVAVGGLATYEGTRDYLKARWPKMTVMARPAFRPPQEVSEEYRAASERADIVVLNSGMSLSYGYYGHNWDGYMGNLLALMMARNAGKPFGVFGHSFDRMDSPAEVLIGGLLSAARFVYTRDSESLALIKSKGVRSPVMGFGPDAAFGFDLREEEKAKAFLQASGLEPGRFLAFVPRLDITRFANDGRERVLAERHRELVTRWVRDSKLPVAVVHEVEREIPNARAMLYEPLPEDVKRLVRFRPEFWWPDEAQSVYARSLAVVSLEMHSVILGLAVGVPSVHPYFQQAGLKQWMMRDIGVPEWLWDIDTQPVEALAAELMSIHQQPEAAREKARKAREFVDARQREMVGVMRSAALG